ncbi:hypothetical protein TWF730_008428 [Orbilia blumenaviensis]|uniref:Uncharacterized protein n=1 Tax=Orbilia blumenaviensis TaxID=1796055 RepID=A0AAV9V3X9_9PEZI
MNPRQLSLPTQARSNDENHYDASPRNLQILIFRLKNHRQTAQVLLKNYIDIHQQHAVEHQDGIDPPVAGESIANDLSENYTLDACHNLLQRELAICKDVLERTDVLFGALKKGQNVITTILICITGIELLTLPRTCNLQSSRAGSVILWAPFTGIALITLTCHLGEQLALQCIKRITKMQVLLQNGSFREEHRGLLSGMTWRILFRLLSIELMTSQDTRHISDFLVHQGGRFLNSISRFIS